MFTKKRIGMALGVLFALFLVIQVVPYGRAHTNPPITSQPNWDSPQTAELFSRACADCHTHETVWPWYSNIAPVSWLVQHDVDEGRSKFNASTGQGEADEAGKQVSEGEMPPPAFLITHPEARLTDAEKQALITGLTQTFGGGRGEGGGEGDGDDD